MNLNPETKLISLLTAIPSAAEVCDRFHIQICGNREKSLERVCAEVHIPIATFLEALDNLNWDEEYRPHRT